MIPIGAIYLYRQKKQLEKEYPNQPWKHNHNWLSGKIKPNENFNKAIFYTLLAVYITVVFGIPLASAFMADDIHNATALYAFTAFVSLFPILLLHHVIKTYRLYLKFGSIHFQMADETGVTGGRLAGLIQINKKLDVSSGFNISIRCIEITKSQNGKNTFTSENVLWEESKTVNKDVLYKELSITGIPILFQIPYDCKPCQDWVQVNPRTKKSIVWRLHVNADLPGLDFQNSFDVPVFKTINSSPDAIIDETKYDEFTYEPTLKEALQGTRVKLLSNTDSHLHIMFASKLSTLIQWIIAPISLSVYLLAQWKLIEYGPQILGGVISIIPIVIISFMMIVIFMLLMGINMYETQMSIMQQGVSVHFRLLFIKTEKHFSLSQINKIFLKVKKHSGRNIQPYKLMLDAGKKPITVTEIIPGRHLAELLEQKINQTIDNFKS